MAGGRTITGVKRGAPEEQRLSLEAPLRPTKLESSGAFQESLGVEPEKGGA